MKIGGIAPFTTIDFPNALAAVLFCQGCPWRCGYCHNPHLQVCSKETTYPWTDVIAFLKRRREFLDAVVLSGGEPTLQPDLVEAVQAIKDLGYKIGLHTGGMFPDALKAVLPWTDWVGMDIKAPFDEYERITQVPQSGEAAKISASMIVQSARSYEFRTTVHPHLLSNPDLIRLAQDLVSLGARHYVLQPFRSQGCENEKLKLCHPTFFDAAFLQQLKGLFETFFVRD